MLIERNNIRKAASSNIEPIQFCLDYTNKIVYIQNFKTGYVYAIPTLTTHTDALSERI